ANYIIVEDSDSLTNSSLSNSDLDFFNNLDFSTNYILSDNSSDLHLDNSSDLHLDNSSNLHLDNSSDLHLDNSSDLHLELQAKIIINVEKISYKVNGRGHAMALDDECDYDAFITECKNL
ncbi:18680_t:CDS:2, partial [Racocetra fulgida]